MLNEVRFDRSVPLSGIAQRRLEKAVNAPTRPRRTPDRSPRALVIEDSADILRLMQFLLETSGVYVFGVRDGQHAMETIEDMPAPDLIIMDRMLPHVSGDDLLRRIRGEALWTNVPVIMVSARVRAQDVRESLVEGANDYVTKPFSPQSFLEVVHRYL